MKRLAYYADPLQAKIPILVTRSTANQLPTEWRAGKNGSVLRRGFALSYAAGQQRGNANPGREWDAFQLKAMQYPGKRDAV